MNTIKIDDISTLSIPVTEKIESKSLHAFLKTTLFTNDVNVSKNTTYYFFYNENTQTYEIVYFENIPNARIELFDIVAKFNKNDNKIKVLVSDTYFIVSKNDTVIVLKITNDVKIDEIKLYIEQMYKIKEFEIIELTQKDKEPFHSSSNTINYKNCYNVSHKNSFYIFCSFVGISFIFFIIVMYFTFYHKDKKISIPIKKDISKKKNHLIISKKIIGLFTTIKNENILLENVTYDSNKMKTTLYHQDKSYLLTFTQQYHQKIDIKSLKYNEQKQMYQMEVSFEY